MTVAKRSTTHVTSSTANALASNVGNTDPLYRTSLSSPKSPDWWVKLGDFGVSKRAKQGSTSLHTAIMGDYSAPEILFGMEEEASSYTSAVDMWSLGCLIHWLLTENLPLSKRELLPFCQERISLPQVHLSTHQSSAEAIDFICKILERRPQNRLTASEGLRHG